VLHVIGGNDRGKLFELTLAEVRIGRGTDQDIVLADIAVSRRHVTIQLENGRYRLRDLGSGNGTLLNGERVDSVLLSDGDQIEIGNTLLRFDHAASRAPAARGGTPPRPAVSPPLGSPFEDPGYPSVPSLPPMPEAPPTPLVSERVASPLSPLGPRILPLLAALESATVRWALLAGMSFLVLVCLVIVVSKLAFAKPAVAPSEAEEHYRLGLKLFLSKDYEGAKIDFNEALRLVPDSAEARHYLAACDREVQARAALQSAERSLTGHRYGEAVRMLDTVDADSLLRDQATKLRKVTVPKAVSEDLDEAARLQQEDPDTARVRLAQALELDPTNPDARLLAAKLKVAADAERPSSPPMAKTGQREPAIRKEPPAKRTRTPAKSSAPPIARKPKAGTR
jgi:Tfp pilus assembly protein PilF